MFSSTFLSRFKPSDPPLLPLSSSPSLATPNIDTILPSPTDASATLLALARQGAYLQSHIQYLLDVQSDRLLEGLGEAPAPRQTKKPTTSTTTTTTPRSSRTQVVEKRLEGVEREIEALGEGRRVWGEVVRVVEDVETCLEAEMRGLGGQGGDGDGDGGGEEGGSLDRVLAAMAQARGTVEGKMRVVEENGWKLLVVCVGAELEALREGERVLRGLLLVGEADGEGGEEVVAFAGVNGRGRGHGHGQERAGTEETYDDDDDEPGPELLISMQEE
ncbi:MAG: hypothetical protein Q9219_004066 [cf. Caloplaca sp. 3 TL-2023]